MSRTITPLNSNFGAEISGTDLSAGVSPALRSDILDAWRQYHVLVIRDQNLSPAQLLDLARGFGTLDLAPPFDNERSDLDGFPEIAVVSNVRQNGVPLGGLGSGELSWHSDMTYRKEPPVGCILQSVELPPTGGNTHFLSMAAALKALPNDVRKDIRDLRLVHDARYTSAGTERQQGSSFAQVDHPLIIVDPLTTDECLFLGRRRQSAVVGLDEDEGQKLLDTIWNAADRSEFEITHVWRPGDLVLWANIAVMHRRDSFDAEQRRLLLRTQVARLN